MPYAFPMNRPAQSLDDRLADFRATYPLVECWLLGHTWRYRRVGSGTEPVLWLTGALGLGELAFLPMLALGEQFSVLAPDYPPARTLDAVSEGLTALLDAEHLDAVHVVGGSLGGMIAQHFVRSHAERVRSLVLSHTSAPEPGRARMLAVNALVGTLALWPEWLVRRMFRRRLRSAFTVGDPFWARYFDGAVAGLSKAHLVSRVRLAAEFAGKKYGVSDAERWSSRVLILESDDDPQMPPATRARLRAIYPQAEVHTFADTGHSVSITDPQRYANVIRSFLLAPPA